jgi:integrase
MAKRTPGLQKRNGVWCIDKRIKGYGRICESCGTNSLDEAERYLVRRLEQIRQAVIYGIRPTRTFAQAAKKYLEENQHKRSLDRDVYALNAVLPSIGDLPLERIHNDSLARYKVKRANLGMAVGTINKELAIVRRILILAARVWRDENGLSWLTAPPLIQMVPGRARKPYPLSWQEQRRLFAELPEHLEGMVLFKVNTGTRQNEVCQLRWDWEVLVPELETTVFIIPEWLAKNGEERIVVLNEVARAVVDRQRGRHPEYVFTYKGHRLSRMITTAWKKARQRVGLPQVRVHDLKHTFGHRLRAAGVPFEERQDLLGHRSGRITTHYSAPDIARLLEAAERVCQPGLKTVLRIESHAKVTQMESVRKTALPKLSVI